VDTTVRIAAADRPGLEQPLQYYRARLWVANPDAARTARPPHRSDAATARPRPPPTRRVGANGRSGEISAATPSGRSWPLGDFRSRPKRTSTLKFGAPRVSHSSFSTRHPYRLRRLAKRGAILVARYRIHCFSMQSATLSPTGVRPTLARLHWWNGTLAFPPQGQGREA
jgi:hypothetical protein